MDVFKVTTDNIYISTKSEKETSLFLEIIRRVQDGCLVTYSEDEGDGRLFLTSTTLKA